MTVDTLLDQALGSENTETRLTIDGSSREILGTDKLLLGVESDEKAKRIHFTCPKIVDEVDLSQLHLYINYQNAKGEKNSYLIDDMTEDGENIVFSWLLSRSVTETKGDVQFIVCAKLANPDGTIINEWNTRVAVGKVETGLEATQELEEQHPDVIEQILARLDVIAGVGGSEIAVGNGLKFENGKLSVDTVETVEKDNAKPVTSGAVYAELGNIEALLKNI